MQVATHNSIGRLFGSEQTQKLLQTIGFIFLLVVGGLIFIGLTTRVFHVLSRRSETCPRCHGAEIRHSRYQKALEDWIMAQFGCVPMRCRDCHRRFYARAEDGRARKAVEE